MRIAHLHGVASSQRRNVVGQLASFRYAGAIDEHWNDRDVSIEGSGNFDPYVIVWLVEPSLTILIFSAKPVRAHSAEEKVATLPLIDELYRFRVRRKTNRLHVPADGGVIREGWMLRREFIAGHAQRRRGR
jgi:hypothetical protein